MFGDRPFTHWPTAVLTGLLFAILFETVYIVAMSLIGEQLTIGLESLSFGLLAFVGYIGIVALIRRSPKKPGAPGFDKDQP